ncbi:MAG TPA: hypothetical protein VHO01_09815 [Jatrophihabitans sp.]|nr:hypothetical protein [Jatrophihabitans sp.]
MTDPAGQAVDEALASVERDFGDRFHVQLDDDAREVIRARLRRGWQELDRTGATEEFPDKVSTVAPRVAHALAASVAVAGEAAGDGENDDAAHDELMARIAGATISGGTAEGVFNRLCPGFWPFC